MALRTTMRAWIVTRAGLQLKTDMPVPAAPTGEDILIKVTHVALNPVDLHLINNVPSWLPFRRNPIPAADFAGEIVALGPEVSHGDTVHPSPDAPGPESLKLAVGMQVCGALPFSRIAGGKGALSEYLVVPAMLVAAKPARLTSAQAAGMMGIAGQTTTIMVNEAKIKPGQRVLVNGASGGVGTILVQALKGRGTVVYGVCSGGNAAMVRGLGAEEVIDYRKHVPLEKYLGEKFKENQLDFIFDCAGSQALFSHSPGYLKKEGKFISIVGGASQGVVPWVRNKLIPVFLGGAPRVFKLLLLLPAGSFAREIAKWVDEGIVRDAPIDSEFAFEEADKAYERLGTKHAKGKVIVKVAA